MFSKFVIQQKTIRTMIQEAKNDLYFINGRALSFTENDLGDPNRIAVSLVSGARIMVYKKGVIDYAPDLEPEKWTLKGYSTRLAKKDPHSIYARLSRLDRTALLVFSVRDYNLDGSVNTITGVDEEGKDIIEVSGPSEEFYYVKIGSVTGTDRDAGDPGIATVARKITYDSGILNSSQDIGIKLGEWSSLFVPHYDDPKDPTKLTWIEAKSHMGIQGGVTMFIDGEGMDLPSIYDGLHIDNDTIYWEEIKDEEGNVIDKVLKARGGSGEGGITPTLLGDLTNVGSWANAIATEDRIMVQRKDGSSWTPLNLSEIGGGSADFSNVLSSGEGNAFTSFVLSDDKKTLTFVKGQTFALKSELDNKWTTDIVKIANWDTAFNWGDHSKVGYAKTVDVTDELKKYVTLGGKETITGEKDFTGGLKVNGSPIVYDKTNKYWKLEGDLLVTGGITMYGVDGSSFGTIWDNAPLATSNKDYKGVASFDPNYFSVSNGYVTFIGQTGGGVADSVAWNDVTGKPKWIGANKPSYTTSEVTEEINLYFTKERAVSALSDTLKGYLLLNGSAAMTGTLQSQIIRPKTSNYYSLGTSSYLWSNVYTKLATIDGIGIKKSASGVLFIDGNLVVSGGITMYGTDGTTAPSIWDGAPKATTSNTPDGKGIASFDSKFFSVSNGHVTFIGDVGGGGGKNLNITLPDGSTKVVYNGEAEKSIVLTRLYKSEEVTTATTDEGTITPLAMNTWTTGKFPLKNGTGATGEWNISIKGNAATSTKVHVTSVANTGPFPIIYTDVSAIGSNGYRSLYCTSKSGTGYNPVNDTLVASCFSGSSVSFGNGIYANLTTKGWYRFAVGGYENSQAGAYIFFIRRQYQTSRNESFVISATVDYGRVVFNQISGATTDNLISKIRATNVLDGRVNFDFYYEGSSSAHRVYVNAIGNATLQAPTSVSSADSYVTEMSLKDGFVTGKSLTCYDYKNLAFIHQKLGKSLLTNGDSYIGASAYLVGQYIYGSSVARNKERTYRLTVCAKLGEENTAIRAYWNSGVGTNTEIVGLSSKEERIVTLTVKVNINTNVNLQFYQFPNGKFGSYVRWAYLEEAFKEGELSSTTDYNNWLTEYNKLDTKSFLYKIQRIDVGNSYWSADNGLNLIDANAYALTMKRTASSGGTFIRMMANNQTTQSWASGVNNAHQFSWWYQDGTSDIEKMKLDSTGNLMSDYWKISNSSTNPYLMLTQGSTWYIQGYQGYLYLGAGSTKSMRIDSGGNVLTVGGITMYSDIRKKTILNHVELSLKEVADAPLIEHYYNSDEAKTTHVGSVAQYWAGLNDWFCKEDGEGFLTMEIQNAALASAISVARELTRYESKTDKQIKKLKKRIGELEEEIENLKNK